MDMSNSNIPTLPLDFTSTQGNKRKKNQAKQQKPNYRSSSNIQCKPQYQIVNNRQTQLPPDYYSSLVDKQLLDEYQHISNQQIVQTQQKIQQFKYMKKQKNEAQFQQYDSSPIPQRQVQRDYRRNVPFQGNRAQNNQRQYQQPEQFRNIMQCNTIEDQQQDDSSPKHPKSVQVLRGKHSRHPQNYYNQHQYIQKQQYAMGNAVDLSKSHDHQNATMMFYDEQLPMESVKSIKRKTKPQKSLNASKLRQVSSNETSNKSQSHSHHPIFRDTLDYVEANRFNLQENFSEHPNQDRYSDGSSISSNGPHTNVDKKESYAYKYKKYKKKTIILQKTMKELEKHNELLLKDMRRNFQYYESQLRDRENTILMKDKQIAQFRHALLVTTNTTTSSQNDHNATSMETRHLESELQRCKKIIQGKQNELKILRNNFQAKEESFQAADQAKNKKIESLQKKLEHSKTKDEYFRNKIESLEKHNALLQQKLKEKEERYFKHQEDLLEAQQQLVALQSRLRAEETSDTQRTFGHQQGQKQKYLINETFSKLPQQEQVQKQQKNSDFEHQFSQIYDAMNKLRTSMGVSGKLPFVKQTKNSPNKKQYQIDCVDDQDNQYVLDQGYDDQVFMQMKKNCGRSFDSRNNFME